MNFDRDFAPLYGRAVEVAPGVRRLTAPNAGPFTFHGTNSYIVGQGTVAIIDPGPDDRAHLAALLKATADERVSHIFVTHAHRDHSEGAAWLKAATSAITVGSSALRLARPPRAGEDHLVEAAADASFLPDIVLSDGQKLGGDCWQFEAIATPGHTADHLAFALVACDLIFSGDHVMAWSTSIVAPPGGNMTAYMASLQRMLSRSETRYLPGHGGPVVDPRAYVRELIAHRQAREAAILTALHGGERTVPEIVAILYRDVDTGLHGAAALSVFAHLEDLVERGFVTTNGAPLVSGRYRLAQRAPL